jgi:hypothetical protein
MMAGSVLFSVPATPAPPSFDSTNDKQCCRLVASGDGFVLQENTNGISSVNWSNVTATIQNDGTNKTLIVNPTSGSRFFRLISP